MSSKLLINEHPLQVLPTLAKWVGLNEAIFLQQIHYWLVNPKVGEMYEGRKWVRNSAQEWQTDNFPFWDIKVIQRTGANLEADGLILSTRKLNKKNYDRTKWYAIDYNRLAELAGPVERIANKAEIKRRAAKSRKVQNVPIDARKVQNVPNLGTKCTNVEVQNVPTYTRDYSETTPEIPTTTKTPDCFSEICKWYQDEIGGLSPIIADSIKDDLNIYPADWIKKAIAIAVERNRRSWGYVRGILKNWQAIGGPQNDGPKQKAHGSNGHRPAVKSNQPIPMDTDFYDRWEKGQ